MKRTVALVIMILITAQMLAQLKLNPSVKDIINQNYNLGIKFKDGNSVPIDYNKAFCYFKKAANLGNTQSVYALAYMHYKGLGCPQNYDTAFELFSRGAFQGKTNSMYFYGLCFRNGYGVYKNEDSAMYWLKMSASNGYKQADQELAMSAPENSNDIAKALVQQINNAATSEKFAINQFQKIVQNLLPMDIVKGNYTGYLIQYDWSGKYVVSCKKLGLDLSGDNLELIGNWSEDGTENIALQASVAQDLIVFKNTSYKRKDHYSPENAIQYNLQNARLNVLQKGDTIFLAGNISMFSPDRKEPSKPIYIALFRVNKELLKSKIDLHVSPNPFSSILNVNFDLLNTASVVTVQLLDINGVVVYQNIGKTLLAGHYNMPIQIGFVASGEYFVKLNYGNRSETAKVVKQ